MRLSKDFQVKLKRFRRDKRAFYSFLFITAFFFLSLPAEWIANIRPILLSVDGRLYFPTEDGLVYVGLFTGILSDAPSLINGFLFGLASVVIPWFVMQPALGLGVMGAKAPNPAVPRYTALAAHCLYGVALYAGSALHTALAG